MGKHVPCAAEPVPKAEVFLIMSLITDWQEKCTIIENKKVPDGEGGFNPAWADGAPFMAAIVLDTSTQAVIAERQGMEKIYRVTTPKNAILSFHDVFRRESDGQTFRVTSDGKDMQTPKESEITPFSQVTAEEWALPLDGGAT